MPRAGSYQTEAITLKKTKLGEADRILTFYTPDIGKVQAVAKGVRRPRAKLAGHLELLTYSNVLLTKGRNLDTITGCQAIESFLPLKTDLDLCARALYATELVYQFGVERQENRPLFALLLNLMRELCRAENRETADGLLRYFEIHLLHAVGYNPQLGACVVCRQPLPASNTAYFSLASGGAVCPRCRSGQAYAYTVSISGLEALRYLQAGDWSCACQVQPDAKVRREMELLLRNYLRYLLERDVRAAAWLDTLRYGKNSVTPERGD
jgi:DNA repair protein RecO (recombination protein O)